MLSSAQCKGVDDLRSRRQGKGRVALIFRLLDWGHAAQADELQLRQTRTTNNRVAGPIRGEHHHQTHTLQTFFNIVE
jgi:hypothetical protein